MKNLIPIFDNGHGGMIGGNYQTPGKRSPNWECGVLYEGMFNRWVVNRLIEKMDRAGLKYYHVSPELDDVGLAERVNRANDIHRINPKTYLLSVHANAGGGVGIEGFTSIGDTGSDPICDAFLKRFSEDFENVQKMRFDLSDGDRDKEANFYVLRKTICPALLLELGFMDNLEDYHNLWSEQYLNALVNSMYYTIKTLQS